MVAAESLQWSDLTAEQQAAFAEQSAILRPGRDTAEVWAEQEAQKEGFQREWLWQHEHPYEDRGAFEAEERRLAEQVDLEAQAAYDRFVSEQELGLSELGVVRLADVAAEQVLWEWPGRIPLGKLTLLEGDPKVGKSTLAVDLIARHTTGSPMPDGERLSGPGNVLLLTAEDGLADTVRPRVDAAGGDANRVFVWEQVLEETDTGRVQERTPSFPFDIAYLEQLIRAQQITLVVIDVLNAYLDSQVDTHHDHPVRRALMPLAKVAERTGAAVVALRHLTKAGGVSAIHRGAGSIGIAGAARSILLAAVDPEDETGTRRVLAVTACNVAAPVPSLAYHLDPDEDHGCARVVWDGVSERSAEQLVAPPPSLEERHERTEARDWLSEVLTEGGEQDSAGIKGAWKATGGSVRTLQRARTDLEVIARSEGFGKNKRSYWSLPENALADPPDHACQRPLPDLGTHGDGTNTEMGSEQGEAPTATLMHAKTLSLGRHEGIEGSGGGQDDQGRARMAAARRAAGQPLDEADRAALAAQPVDSAEEGT